MSLHSLRFYPSRIFLLSILLLVPSLAIGSEAYIESVVADVESYKDNPWGIFEVIVDADTPSDDLCETVTFSYEFYSIVGGVDLWEFPDEPLEVCGLDFHPKKQIFAHDGFESDENE